MKTHIEMWLDSESNYAEVFDCELNIENDTIRYVWLNENNT
jgi:hypothetical protein